MTNSPPKSWFGPKTIYDQIQHYFPTGQSQIRIASGFFTIQGWNLIREATTGKHVDLLVGINESNKRSDIGDAQVVLIQEIMQDLATGLAGDRRQAVEDLVARIRARQFRIVDARAMKHHAKVYLVDREIAIITSANLTVNGLTKQIEAGDRLAQKEEVIKLVEEFNKYFAKAIDLTQKLLEALLRWLNFASPWDVYLKTLLALEDLDIDSRYIPPTNYQRDMITQTLRQIRNHDGSILVASTGLGKTVVATHVAIQLFKADEIRNILIIGPKLVKKQWASACRDASIPHDYIGYQALDKEDAKYDIGLDNFLEIEKKLIKNGLSSLMKVIFLEIATIV